MWRRSWILSRYGFGRRQPWTTWKFYLGDNVETNSVSWSNRQHSCLVSGRSWYKCRPAGGFQWLLFVNFLVTLLHVMQDWQSVQQEQQLVISAQCHDQHTSFIWFSLIITMWANRTDLPTTGFFYPRKSTCGHTAIWVILISLRVKQSTSISSAVVNLQPSS